MIPNSHKIEISQSLPLMNKEHISYAYNRILIGIKAQMSLESVRLKESMWPQRTTAVGFHVSTSRTGKSMATQSRKGKESNG